MCNEPMVPEKTEWERVLLPLVKVWAQANIYRTAKNELFILQRM